jgi:hypothetical protein
MSIKNIYKLAIAAILLFITVYITVIYYNTNYQKPNNRDADDVNFLTFEETSAFLERDEDGYVRNMSSADLYARKVNNTREYIDSIKKCCISYSDAEKMKIKRCAEKADEFLRTHIYKNKLNCAVLVPIKWKFALTYKNDANQYEDGLPHTRKDIIFLSKYSINKDIADDNNDQTLVNTLIHEKVHIYQRYNKQKMEDLVRHMGYSKISVKLSDDILRRKRSNPDITDDIYHNSATNKEMIFTYKSETPSSINDTDTSSFAMEHPYETMAYDIANAYSQSYFQKITTRL